MHLVHCWLHHHNLPLLVLWKQLCCCAIHSLPALFWNLFKTITDVLSSSEVPASNGETHKVWSLDENMQYGVTPGHIVLIVVALLFFIPLLVLLTLTLLLVPFLRAKSHLRPLRWINTLKPFIDIYYGPLKDKKQHHVWTGILLISREVILIVNALTSTSTPKSNILLLILIAASLFVYNASAGPLYRKDICQCWKCHIYLT